MINKQSITLIMAISRRVNKKQSPIPSNVGSWSLGAVIFAIIFSLLGIASLFAPSQITILKGRIFVTNGMIFAGLMLGGTFWGVVEFVTPPGKGLLDLLSRVLPSFFIGLILGALLAYYYAFGQFSVIPYHAGILLGQIYVFSLLISFLAVTWNAAWGHSHGFLGQKGKGVRKTEHGESGTSKGRRGMLSLLVIFLAGMIMVPGFTSLGQEITGYSHQAVSSNNLYVNFVGDSNSSVPFSSLIKDTSIPYLSETSFSMPTFEKNVSGNITLFYTHHVVMQMNITVGELNHLGITNLVLNEINCCNLYSGYANLSFGKVSNKVTYVQPSSSRPVYTIVQSHSFTSNNTSNKSINYIEETPLPQISLHINNSNNFSFNISPDMLTGNQSAFVLISLDTNVTSIGFLASMIGPSSSILAFSPYNMMLAGMLLTSIFLLGSTGLLISAYDLSIMSRRK